MHSGGLENGGFSYVKLTLRSAATPGAEVYEIAGGDVAGRGRVKRRA
ncbi:MAG TPA: hypothetical protein VGI39_06835 [Polyangiaceae bacterium]|jgi:hypothetical protein